MTEILVRTDSLTKSYLGKPALLNFTCDFARGATYGLLGPNGSGKTTLMKLLAGLHQKSSGILTVFDKQLTWRTKAQVAFMPTEPFIYDEFTVRDCLNYFADMFDGFRRSEAEELLTRENIASKMKAGKLSSGMHAKLKFTMTAMRQAELYMFDEPLNGIDLIARDYVIVLLKRLRDEGKTQIISSHLVNELEQVIDHAIFLHNGETIATGTCDELRAKFGGKSITDIYREIYANV